MTWKYITKRDKFGRELLYREYDDGKLGLVRTPSVREEDGDVRVRDPKYGEVVDKKTYSRLLNQARREAEFQALVQLLIDKGIFTETEYFTKLKQVQAENESRKAGH